MALLLGTNITTRVDDLICGRIARVGGSVNQLLVYGKSTIKQVVDFNLLDDFFGARSVRSARDIGLYYKFLKTYVRQELGWLLKGYAVPRDRKTLILDVHKAYMHNEMRAAYDSVISSNLIEHSPNPIFLLLNLHYLVRKDGYHFHAIPHYKYTYDCHRKPTPLAHFIEDFENRIDESDKTHNEDYCQSAIDKHGSMRKFHEKYPVAPPYIHFHVFDEFNTRELIEFMFQDVTNDVLKTEKYSDNVVLFSNKLNVDFVARYQPLIDEYSPAFLEER